MAHDELRSGSVGAGVCISRGCLTRVRTRSAGKGSWEIFMDNERAADAIVSETVVKYYLALAGVLRKVRVDHWFGAPVGYGLGSSGAAALSLSLAMNEVLGLGLSRIRAAQLAHCAEVRCKTGLGAVAAELMGGMVIRSAPGAPGIGSARRVDHVQGIVTAIPLARLSTRRALSDPALHDKIVEAMSGERFTPTSRDALHHFLRKSRRFSQELGIADKRTRAVLRKLRGTSIWSLAMLGQTPFTIVDRDGMRKVWDRICKIGVPRSRVIMATIDARGARLIP